VSLVSANQKPRARDLGIPFDGKTGSLLEMLPNDRMSPLFLATVQATEEAIADALIAAETMTGIHDNKVYVLPHVRLTRVLKKYNRLAVP